jgi:hypothetical protein
MATGQRGKESRTSVKGAILAVLAMGIASAVGAQSTPTEARINQSLDALRRYERLSLRMDGTEFANGRSTPFTIYAAWFWRPAEGLAMVEIREFRDEQLVRRTAADGVTLWSYDLRTREYTANTYGSHGAQQPAGYRRSLLYSAQTLAQGPSIYIARLLRETYAGEAAHFKAWVPGANSEFLGAPTEDPVLPERWYTPSPRDEYVLDVLGDPAYRSNAFHMRADEESIELVRVFFAEWTSRTRRVEWTISVYPDYLWEDTSFRFEPPAGSRPLVSPRGPGGGGG